MGPSTTRSTSLRSNVFSWRRDHATAATSVIVVLNAAVLYVQPTVQLSSPCATPVFPVCDSVRVSRRHETSPSLRYIDIWRTIVQPTTTSTSLRSNAFSWRRDHATHGHISYRSIQRSKMTRRVLLTLCVVRHASVTILFFGILYYKCEIRLSAFDEFINTDVCGTVLKF